MPLGTSCAAASLLIRHHAGLARQLLWLLFYACASCCEVLLLRLLVHYHGFSTPCLLALIASSAVAVVARACVFLTNSSSSSSSSSSSTSQHSRLQKSLHHGLVGVLMGSSLALHIASLRQLPVPILILLQALAPAVSYWVAVLLAQEPEVDGLSAAKAVAVFCVFAAVLVQPPPSQHISIAGLALQLSALLLDVLWRRLQLSRAAALSASSCSHSNSSSTAAAGPDAGHQQQLQLLRPSSSGGSTRTTSPAAPLLLLADASLAAALALLLPMLLLDLRTWRVEQFRLQPSVPMAGAAVTCMCVLMLLKVQPPVLQGLTVEPAGPLVRSLRDGLLALLAARLLNEHIGGRWQWAAYAVAQLAGVSLLIQAKGSSCCGRQAAGAFSPTAHKAPPVLLC